MQIAIVAPSPVPFCIGGAEKLWWGLLEGINQTTSHQADLIKLPNSERNFWEVIDGYKRFSELDLSHFDLVISGKYPGWMVQHPNHTCYMLHRLRGLYDTYHFTGQPETQSWQQSEIAELQKLLRHDRPDRDTLKEVFSKLGRLRTSSDSSPNAMQFPGSLIREIVHFIDGVGLAPDQIKKYAAIAQNVANRKDYFPLGSTVDVIYPPSNLKNFYSEDYDYLFTVSRLDSAKRVSLLIQSMQYVKAKIQLKIAGTGPDVEALKKLAKDDERIVFLGFVNDEQIVDLYANALAVPYVPYDEDYGLVTIEAMKSCKPVLTTIDAGGPTEFVFNGETGFSVPPDPEALAERIDYLCEHRDEAKQMGLTGQKLVAGITWENTTARLLNEKPASPRPIAPKRKKITVALTFPVFPPRGGGQGRVFHLYRQLAKHFDIELVSLTNADQEEFRGEIAPKLYETRIAKSKEHQQQEWAIEQKIGIPVSDIAMPKLYHYTPIYLEVLKASAQTSDFVIACHPYLLPAIQSVCQKPIWYEAQDVEVSLKKRILPNNQTGHELLECVRKIEHECCQVSQLVMTCSSQDALAIGQTYSVDSSKIIVVPNGVDLEEIKYISREQSQAKKAKLGLSQSFTALFLGSWHNPNIEAVNSIFELAKMLPDINFLVVGSVGLAFQTEKRPDNVGFLGTVDEQTKAVTLELADVALNPVTFGSGTNLKMLEYFAAGIPVISTPVGARGLGVEDGKHCTIVELQNFAKAIVQVKSESLATKSLRIQTARSYVQTQFDWKVIANNFLKAIALLLD
jgi:glycosyltransferase involved in cell wall biosynthesis